MRKLIGVFFILFQCQCMASTVDTDALDNWSMFAPSESNSVVSAASPGKSPKIVRTVLPAQQLFPHKVAGYTTRLLLFPERHEILHTSGWLEFFRKQKSISSNKKSCCAKNKDLLLNRERLMKGRK
jgi:hypothetical protein